MADPEVEIIGLGGFALGPIALGAYGFSEEPQAPTKPGVRVLDPGTGDYLVDGGVIQRASTARQRVIISLSTLYGTSMATRGIQFSQVHDGSTERVTEQEVLTVLKPMIDDGSIRIDGIEVRTQAQNVPGRLGISVQYFDFGTGKPDTVDA